MNDKIKDLLSTAYKTDSIEKINGVLKTENN